MCNKCLLYTHLQIILKCTNEHFGFCVALNGTFACILENDCEMGEESGRKNKRRKSDPSPGCSESLTKKDIVPTVTSPAMQPFVEVPKRVGLFAFSRKNEAQLNEDGIPLTQEDCADVAILNRNGCIEDNGGTHITSLTAEGSHLHVSNRCIALLLTPQLVQYIHV